MNTNKPETKPGGSEIERDERRGDDKPKQAGEGWHGTPPERIGADRNTDGDLRPGGDTSAMPARKQ